MLMPKPNPKKTKRCSSCGAEFECERASARYCSPACKQAAYRLRHLKPVSLDQATRSQRRASRKRDLHVQRAQQLGGVAVLGLPKILPDMDVARAHDERGRARRIVVRDGVQIDSYSLTASLLDPVVEEVLWHLEGESDRERWQRLRFEAAVEWLYDVLRPDLNDVPIERPRLARQLRWFIRWRWHPELTEEQRKFVVWRVSAALQRAARDQGRQEQMEAIVSELRDLRREVKEGFAHIEARLAEISRANPDDGDFEREIALLLQEASDA